MAEEKKVETRKIQRLGTSSLVVTLPKSWVNKVNLKPGDTVYVIVEDDTVRIVPGSLPRPEPGKLILELKKDEAEKLAAHVISCLYVMGHREVYIKLHEPELEIINRILESASRLLGAEASCQGDNVVRFNVVLDSEKVDLNAYVIAMLRNLSLLVLAIKRASTDSNKGDLDSIKMLFNEVSRTQHFIIRHLLLYLRARRTPLTLAAPPQSVLIASTLLGQAGLIAYRASEMIMNHPDRSTIQDWISIIADEVSNIMNEFSQLIRKPDPYKSVELVDRIEMLRTKAVGSLSNPVQAYVASKLEDFLDIMKIVGLVLLCTAIEARLREDSRAP